MLGSQNVSFGIFCEIYSFIVPKVTPNSHGPSPKDTIFDFWLASVNVDSITLSKSCEFLMLRSQNVPFGIFCEIYSFIAPKVTPNSRGPSLKDAIFDF